MGIATGIGLEQPCGPADDEAGCTASEQDGALEDREGGRRAGCFETSLAAGIWIDSLAAAVLLPQLLRPRAACSASRSSSEHFKTGREGGWIGCSFIAAQLQGLSTAAAYLMHKLAMQRCVGVV
jgi:hypothetical protein